MADKDRLSFDSARLTKASAAYDSSSSEADEDDFRIPGVEDGGDEFGDFNPRKRRRVGKDSKEKAALGIFGSDSEDDGPGSRWKRKTLRRKGMTFVPTATTTMKSDDEMNSENDKAILGAGANSYTDDNDDDDEEDENDKPTAGLGLGFSRGFGSTFLKESHDPSDNASQAEPPPIESRFNGKGVLGMGFVPSSAKEPVLRDSVANDDRRQNKPQPSAFTKKGKINAKGFGARMMAKMGYVEGTGLGKESQGRNIIIEANLRPQGVGLGAVKEKSDFERQEEKRQARLRGEEVIESDEEAKKRRRAKKKTLSGATGSGASTPRRQKTKFLTAEELKSSAPGLHIPEAFAPILDMTGPGSKVLTSTSGIMTPKTGVSEPPELVEARKLVKRAQADLQAFSEEWRNLAERKSWTELEVREREREIEELQSDFERLKTFAGMVTQELTIVPDWNQTIECLKRAAEIGISNIEIVDIAVAALHPFLRDTEWEPLSDPSRFASDLDGLSTLLLKPEHDGRAINKWRSSSIEPEGIYRRHQKATTPYESMMYKSWLPKVVTAVREWDPLTPGPMLDVVESWNNLLPPFIRAQVMDHIARKLETAVSDWNPKKKRQSQHMPHTWLFPWLQHLPSHHLDPKGTGLVADVKRKFRQLIDVWEFERGTIPGLKQWEDILAGHWRPLILSHVLPSMGRYLRMNFRVDPADQEPYLPILTGVMKWKQMLGDDIIGEVLIQNVFPMWYDKLREWLTLAEADLQEVAEWYSWWRGMLLKDMAHITGVKAELDKGLYIMNIV